MDLFQQQGISFSSAPLASTHPTATPPPIPAGHVDQGAEPSIPPVNASALQPPQGQQQRQNGAIPPPPDPQQISQAVSGAGNAGSAPAGAAPPQPAANSNGAVDLFQQEGIGAPDFSDAAPPTPFQRGVNIADPQTPQEKQVAQYASDNLAQAAQLAQKRFTPQQMTDFANNPVSMKEAIENQNDWPDVPALITKLKDGDTLNSNQQGRLNEYIDTVLSNTIRGRSWDGQTAVETTQLPPIVQDYVNSGKSGNVADSTSPAPNQTILPKSIIPGTYTPQVGEKPISDYAAVTDKGQQIMAAANEKPASTALKVTAFDDLPTNVRAALYEGYLAKNPTGNLPALQTTQGYHAAVDAVGESGLQKMLTSVQSGTASSPFDHYVQEAGRDVLTAGTYINPYTLATRLYDIPLTAVQHLTQIGLQNLPKDSLFYSAPGQQPTTLSFGKLYDWIGEQLFPGGAPESKTAEYVDTAATFAGGGAAVKAETVGARALNSLIGAAAGTGGQFSQEKAEAWAKQNFPDNPTVQALISETAGLIGMAAAGGAAHIGTSPLRAMPEPPTGSRAFEEYANHITSSPDQAMVKNGIVSVDGAKSDPTTATETILTNRGIAPDQAQEVASNLTATEKDNFIARNQDLPQSPAPTLPENSPATLLADRRKAQGPDTAKNIIASATNAENASSPPPIAAEQSGFNAAFQRMKKIYPEMWNDLQPIEDLGTIAREKGADINDTQLSPASLSLAKSTPALTERQWTTGTTTWDKEGNQVVTGRGLKQIRDDFDNTFKGDEPNRATRQQDLDDFENAMTFIEDRTNDLSNVSDKDYGESRATLARLSDKYGDKMRFFESFAKQERDWDNRILHNLVTSGLKTQAWYDETTGKREWYSSTARVIEQEFPDDSERISKNLGTDVNPRNIGALKERKGSELEVMDKTQSRMRNSAIIMRRSMLNKVRNDVADFAQFYPEKVQVKPPALIRAAVEHSYDPKLRTKLEQVADFLGGQVKRQGEGEKVPQLRGNLGAYEPATKTTFLKPGTTEGTLTHEIGHMLDYTLGLKDRLLNNNEFPQIKGELEKLAEDRLRSRIELEKTPDGKTQFREEFEKNPAKYVSYVKKPEETLANFFDAWVNSPEQVERVAPTAKREFERMIDENPQLSMLKEIEPSTQRATETLQRELLDYKGPKGSLPFYKNGSLQFLHMDEDVERAFKGLDQVQATMVKGFINKVLNAQSRGLQFGATNNPYFIARHFLRGAQSSYVNTPLREGPMGFFNHFAVEIPKGIAAVIGKSDTYREWASSSGALRTFMDISDKGLAKTHDQIFNSGDMSKFLNPKNWAKLAKNAVVGTWETAKQVSDYAPRIAAYDRMKKAGYSDLEAGYLSLEATGNYIRHGSVGKEINAKSPFFNDRLQGADRFLRAVKRDPAGYSMRAMALITMPQLLVSGYYLFAADDQTRKEYLNLSDFRRSAAMNIKMGNQWIPIPRAFAPGFAFGAIPEFAMIHYSGIAHAELKNFWLHLIGDTMNSLSPSTDWTQTIPPLIKAAIEAKANFSFYRNMPIFSGDVNKTAPENQFNSSTSESAKAIGKFLGISPAKIDNTAYDMAAHIGVYAEQLGDIAINNERRLSGQAVNQRPTRGSDNPIYGPMMQPAPVGTAGESFQEFNEHVQDTQQQKNRFNELKGPDKAAFQQENHADLVVYPTVNAANTQVHHLEHEIRMITQNIHLSGDEKAQQIAQRQQQIELVIDGANRAYHNVEDKK